MLSAGTKVAAKHVYWPEGAPDFGAKDPVQSPVYLLKVHYTLMVAQKGAETVMSVPTKGHCW